MGAAPVRKIIISYKKAVKNGIVQYIAERKETGLNLGEFKNVDDLKDYCERLYKRPMFKMELIFMEDK